MEESTLDSRLVAETEAYVDEVADCVGLLPKLLDSYTETGDCQDVVEDIRARETECDETNRRISALITNATVKEIGLRNTRIHMNSPDVVDLYQRVDDIANDVERLAEELLTIAPPPRDRYFRQYEEMAECATSAMSALDRAVTTFTHLLCTASESGSISEEIAAIRAAESDCDRLRNEIIAGAFSDDSLSDPWAYHRFAHLFDDLVDSIEDVTDQLVLISSDEDWIATEK